ncbi:DUF3168 domain-containing protein [Paenibacillus ginsengihumi]|uniref:DUF3168 domain-containing protein n=1 Tax=Paenibacillus ginsengihumi TaxID=431596 RepID=UPI000379DA35|nr:DUF3168 domain-containing protein [Paenibacillus ginsengihumi]
MDFEAALTHELKTNIVALENRVYPLTAPEATAGQGVPYLIYASSEGLRDKALDGYMQSKAVHAEVNIVAARYGDMKAIARQVSALLIGMEGRVIGTDGPFIEELTYRQDPVEIYENQPGLYRCMIEFTVYFNEEDET